MTTPFYFTKTMLCALASQFFELPPQKAIHFQKAYRCDTYWLLFDAGRKRIRFFRSGQEGLMRLEELDKATGKLRPTEYARISAEMLRQCRIRGSTYVS